MSDKQKDQGDRQEVTEAKAAPEVQRSAVIADGNNQARWLRAQQLHSSDQNKSATDMYRKPGEAPVSTVKFGIDGLANDRPTGLNANGKPYVVHTQEATQALEKPSPISKSTTEGPYQSEIKMSVQITNVPEVPPAVTPQEAMKYTSKVMEAGAQSVRQTEDYLAKPNAVNNSLNDMAVAGSKLPGYFQNSPEQLSRDAQTFAGAVMQKTGEVVQAIDKPMTAEERAKMAGGMLPFFFFEGGKKIDPKVAKQMGLEQLTEADLKALSIEKRIEKAGKALELAQDKLTRESVDEKLTRYLLDPGHPRQKSRWFEKVLGFTLENKEQLANQIKFDEKLARPSRSTAWGITYEQPATIVGANGRTLENCRIYWQQNYETGLYEFKNLLLPKKK
jgi:hypothetical protein